jgi:hypothetical protein
MAIRTAVLVDFTDFTAVSDGCPNVDINAIIYNPIHTMVRDAIEQPYRTTGGFQYTRADGGDGTPKRKERKSCLPRRHGLNGSYYQFISISSESNKHVDTHTVSPPKIQRVRCGGIQYVTRPVLIG